MNKPEGSDRYDLRHLLPYVDKLEKELMDLKADNDSLRNQMKVQSEMIIKLDTDVKRYKALLELHTFEKEGND